MECEKAAFVVGDIPFAGHTRQGLVAEPEAKGVDIRWRLKNRKINLNKGSSALSLFVMRHVGSKTTTVCRFRTNVPPSLISCE